MGCIAVAGCMSRWTGEKRRGREWYEAITIDTMANQHTAGGDRVAIISGAGSESGIGFATATRLAASGVRVLITSTTNRILDRANELNTTFGGGHTIAVGVAADLTQEVEARAVVDAALKAFGRVDVLINNAGMTSVTDAQEPETMQGLDLRGWNRAIERNLTTAYLLTRAALPHVLRGDAGRIVTVSSVSGPLLAYRGDIGYHAGKAGLVGMTRALAVDVAESGVTVNAVAPGWIATGSATEHEIRMGEATPMRRSGTPDEVAAMIEFLASRGASYVTGQLLVVDGGNSIQDEKG